MAKTKQELIEKLFEKGILASQDILEKEVGSELFHQLEAESDLMVLNSDYANIVSMQATLVDWYDLDRYKVEAEKERDDDLYQSQLQTLKKASLSLITPHETHHQEESSLELELNLISPHSTFSSVDTSTSSITTSSITAPVLTPSLPISSISPITSVKTTINIVLSYENKPHKYEVKDFSTIFTSRYRFLEKILRYKPALSENLTSISRIQGKKEREHVSLIGMVEEVGVTKSGNIMISLEDLTGKVKVLIKKDEPELFSGAKELVPDEIIGITGTCSEHMLFGDKIVWPDIPAAEEMKKSPEDVSAIFLSDFHVGSKMFLREEVDKFMSWLNGNTGNEAQKEAAAKVKYIFIAGDLVDGIGIYPSQEEELDITEIKAQYLEFVKIISQIPFDKQIILCPGNHDLVHLAEPQSIIYKEYCPELHALPNVTLVTNPALINIAKTSTFPGFDVLMYHGYSFDHYVANVEPIRNGGGYSRADLIMKFLLKRRHLAPTFKSTPYFPAHLEDPLLIKKVPDFLVSGHIHYSKVAHYKGVTMICGSCWQSKTAFQEKMGHEPEPGRVPLVNLKTREVKILRFA
ncbi:metallophosphoesterase [Candidatus Woesearchaeota archaeon]|nr:metallophosphoesterase [Candidatus Woesearchaeota archaeon]